MTGPAGPDVDPFETGADHYADDVERSVSFTRRGLDYFTWRKAERLVELVRQHLGPPDELAALDVGCGVGTTDGFLVERFGSLIGVDPAEAAIAQAAQDHPGVDYRIQVDDRLPVDDAVVDLAFAINVLHHVQPPDRAFLLSELHRVVRPGGLVLVFEHNPWNPLTRLSVFRCELDDDAVLVRRSHLRTLLQRAGLQPIDDEFILFTTSRSPRVLALEQRLGWLPMGAQYGVVARRTG